MINDPEILSSAVLIGFFPSHSSSLDEVSASFVSILSLALLSSSGYPKLGFCLTNKGLRKAFFDLSNVLIVFDEGTRSGSEQDVTVFGACDAIDLLFL